MNIYAKLFVVVGFIRYFLLCRADDDPQYVHNLETLLNYSFFQNYFTIQKLPDIGFNGAISLIPNSLKFQPHSNNLIEHSNHSVVIAMVTASFHCHYNCGTRYMFFYINESTGTDGLVASTPEA